jgi:hypothetical protein
MGRKQEWPTKESKGNEKGRAKGAAARKVSPLSSPFETVVAERRLPTDNTNKADEDKTGGTCERLEKG